MLRRLILFLVRKKLGVRKYEGFQFINQKSPDNIYFFTDDNIIKSMGDNRSRPSSVSLNWLLNDKCEIDNADCFTDTILCRHIKWLASKGVNVLADRQNETRL